MAKDKTDIYEISQHIEKRLHHVQLHNLLKEMYHSHQYTILQTRIHFFFLIVRSCEEQCLIYDKIMAYLIYIDFPLFSIIWQIFPCVDNNHCL